MSTTVGDDEVGLILNWVQDQTDRNSFSQVCKQWLRVEGQTRQSIRILEPESLTSFLPRFPNLLSLESPKLLSNTHLKFISQTCPKLEILNLNLKQTRQNLYDDDDDDDDLLSVEDFGDDGLCSLSNGCLKLSKVLLRKRKNIANVGVIAVTKSAKNLTNLDLGRCNLVSDQALEAIAVSDSIRVLNLEACSLITDKGLAALSNGLCSKTLKKLVLAECDRVTDFGVSLLQQMCCLEELNLAECGPKVTDFGGVAVASVASLKRLNFAWLISVSDLTLIAIAENCRSLVRIDLTGCELITGVGIRAFANHECLEDLVLASCYNICGDDLDMLLQCQSLRYIVLDKGLRMWIPMSMQENVSRVCELHWR